MGPNSVSMLHWLVRFGVRPPPWPTRSALMNRQSHIRCRLSDVHIERSSKVLVSMLTLLITSEVGMAPEHRSPMPSALLLTTRLSQC
jgi:hypothetical protein